ncbi:hypothetical protein Tco_1358208 [Tanacetum coccineum]
MKQDNTKQAAREKKLVPSEDKVKIGKKQSQNGSFRNSEGGNLSSCPGHYQNIILTKPFLILLGCTREIFLKQFFYGLRSEGSLMFIGKKLSQGLTFRPSKIRILWGIYDNVNVDYAALIWEDLQYQIDNRQSKVRRREIMPYPRLKFINKGDIYQVYGKPIPDTSITDEIKKSKAYKMYFKYFTGLIPLKRGRGRGAQEGKTTVTPQKPTKPKKKSSKKKQVLRDESDESEGELENRPTGRKKRTPRAVAIQEPPSVLVNKTQESSGNLKGIEFLSDAAQFEIDTQKAMKASKRTSRFQHQIGGLSKGAGLRPKGPDEPLDKSANSDEGVGTSSEVLDESRDKNEARYDLDDWGSTDDEKYLLAYKDDKPEDIPWQSTDDDESENDDEEDDASIDIEKTGDERTDTDDEDTVMGKAEKTVEQ